MLACIAGKAAHGPGLPKVLARAGLLALVAVADDDQHVGCDLGRGGCCVTGKEKGMLRIEGEIVINRPMDEVFDFVADARNEPLYNPRMLRAEKLSPGPIGLGSRFCDEIKFMGRSAEITMEIIGYDRPWRLTDSIHLSTMDIRGGLRFDPVPAGTRMRWSWELMPRGVFKLMTPMVARIGRRQEQQIWAGLKRSMEAQAASSSTTAVL